MENRLFWHLCDIILSAIVLQFNINYDGVLTWNLLQLRKDGIGGFLLADKNDKKNTLIFGATNH